MTTTPEQTAPKYDSETLAARGEGRAAALPRRLGVESLEGARVLEFGCGRGEVTMAARRLHGADAIGVDIEDRWRRFPEYAASGRLFKADILDGWSHGPVDYIHSYTVFEHVRRPVETIEALFKIL